MREDDSGIQPFSRIIERTFSNIRLEDAKTAVTLADEWRRILCRIESSVNPSEGRNLADHSRVLDLRSRVLFIEADHPGWIELLQIHKKFILRGLAMKFPQLKIGSLAFRLSGAGSGVFPREEAEDVRRSMELRISREESANREAGIDSAERPSRNSELPDEIKSIFSSWMDGGNSSL